MALLCCLAAAPAAAQKKAVNLLKTWGGKHKNEVLMKDVPEHGFLANEKEFQALWKSWRGDEQLPAVDFKKELVLVAVAGGPNIVGIVAFVDDGQVKVFAESTRKDGPGFGYQFATVSRAGIKTINGKAVPAP